jgi:type III pantothenate kinase
MTLLVDLGNSALKWARAEDLGRGAVHTVLHRAADDWANELAECWRGEAGARDVVGCSVAGAAERAAVERAAAAAGLTLRWLGAQARHEDGSRLENGYRNPAQLGADRWHALIGACARHPQCSFVLATAGTALTVDCVILQPTGARFVGGAIAPGARLMLEALAGRTAGLPRAAGQAVDFPDNTDDAITTGVADAQAGLVLRLLARLAQRAGAAPLLLVSGGDAPGLAARCAAAGAQPTIEHNLVLAGLAVRAAASSS